MVAVGFRHGFPPTMLLAAWLTGCVACQKVPVTGVEGIEAMLTGWVACQKVPVTAVVGALSTATCKLLPVPWVAVTVPEIGCVACQKVPLTGCVVCQKVPVTGVDGIEAIETG